MQNTILHRLTQKSTLEILALEMVVRGAHKRNSHGGNWSPPWPYLGGSRTLPNHQQPTETTGTTAMGSHPLVAVCVAPAIKSLPSSRLLLQMEVWAAPHCGCRQQRVGDTDVHAESSLQIDALPWQIPGVCIWKACRVLCWQKLCGVQNIV